MCRTLAIVSFMVVMRVVVGAVVVVLPAGTVLPAAPSSPLGEAIYIEAQVVAARVTSANGDAVSLRISIPGIDLGPGGASDPNDNLVCGRVDDTLMTCSALTSPTGDVVNVPLPVRRTDAGERLGTPVPRHSIELWLRQRGVDVGWGVSIDINTQNGSSMAPVSVPAWELALPRGRRSFGQTAADVEVLGMGIEMPNLSGFYHQLLLIWAESAFSPAAPADVLLVSETEPTKLAMAARYPSWSFKTTNMFVEADERTDFLCDLSAPGGAIPPASFDVIINQATLEHVIDPLGVLRGHAAQLRPGGLLVLHTHPAEGETMPYHGYPRDYLRYHPTWFTDAARSVGLNATAVVVHKAHIFVKIEKPRV
mmetsp:Transcript_1274/g.4034  ORF Transcript_1274/g.4034 Transcript_1274/m.4034 type:complete len:366 (-) Transcript_1274:391-1488(-)